MGLKRIQPKKARLAKMHRIASGYEGFTTEFKRAVLQRDNYRCRIVKNGVRCNQPARHVHHLVRVGSGGKTSMANCISICEGCHAKRPGHGHMHSHK